MRAVRQIVSFVMLLVLCGLPAMACLIPGAEMTATERECCKRMAEQCGSMEMPSSHSCCQEEISQPNSMLSASLAQLTAPALSGTVTGELPQPQAAQPSVSSFEFQLPPESPPGASSILRI